MNAKVLFDLEANNFDNVIPLHIPQYDEIYDILIDSIPYGKSDKMKILDIGSGTGTFAKILKEKFPDAKITCLDFSKNMVEMAKKKLSRFSPDIDFVVRDFKDINRQNEFDVIVSSFALHHIKTDSEKLQIYGKIYQALKEKGIFLNADVVLGVNRHINNMYEKKWEQSITPKIIKSGLGEKTIEKYQADDNPSMLFEHLKWLETSGFEQVEAIWKYYNFAIYGGFKFKN